MTAQLQCEYSIKEWYKHSCNLWLVSSFKKYKHECFISPWNIFKFQKWIYKMYVSNKKIDAIFLFTIRNIFKNSDAHIFIPRNLDFSKKSLFSFSVLSFLSAPFIKIFSFDKCNKCYVFRTLLTLSLFTHQHFFFIHFFSK